MQQHGHFGGKRLPWWRLLFAISVISAGLAGCQPEVVLPASVVMPKSVMSAPTLAVVAAPSPTLPAMLTTEPATGSVTGSVTNTLQIVPVELVVTPLAIARVIFPTPTPQASVAPTAPSLVVLPEVASITYTVVEGDSLYAIAMRYGVTVNDLSATNGLVDSLIYPGQPLIIPTGNAPAQAAPEVESPVALPAEPVGSAELYRFSPLYSDLTAGYPAALARDRFTLHYAPDRPPVGDVQAIADLVQRALGHHEQLLGVTLAGRFDIYAVGTIFAPPDQPLRGRSFSIDRRTVFLFDGSGNAADQQYIVAHELTHLFVWNTFGAPVSVMLSEGVAVYAGMELIADSGHMPIRTFCSAYLQAGVLPRISQQLDYLGHIRNLENYYAAGCFVQFLVEQYGAALYGQLYPSGDFSAVYGKTVDELEAEWIADLAANPVVLPFAPAELVAAVANLEASYGILFADFSGTPDELAAYWVLDGRRLALMEGRLQPTVQNAVP